MSITNKLSSNFRKSVWTLAYFLTKDNKLLDSRVTEFRNVTHVVKIKLSDLKDVRGHVFNVLSSQSDLHRYDQLFGIFLNGKMDQQAKLEFKNKLEEMFKNMTNGNIIHMTTSVYVFEICFHLFKPCYIFQFLFL